MLNNPDTVLAEHLRIEEKLAVGNPPEVRQQAERAKSALNRFKQWQAAREAAESMQDEGPERPRQFLTFREWMAEKT